tara:strand:- start:829 stop:1464 length:636 start_codon:yes stop_codon:yes gene_type:complete
MYYRKISYPADGRADDPSELWEEFQRIRSYLSSVDQNNIEHGTIRRDSIARPDSLDHSGITDIIGMDGDFLYSEGVSPSGEELLLIDQTKAGHWFSLGQADSLSEVSLRAASRGAAPWIVAASVDVKLKSSKNAKPSVRLRVTSSQGGLSVAESVGGVYDTRTSGCSLGVITAVLSEGGSLDVAPSVMVSGPGDWAVRVRRANIWAFGLYN